MVNFLPTIFGFWLFRNFLVLTKNKIKLLFMKQYVNNFEHILVNTKNTWYKWLYLISIGRNRMRLYQYISNTVNNAQRTLYKGLSFSSAQDIIIKQFLFMKQLLLLSSHRERERTKIDRTRFQLDLYSTKTLLWNIASISLQADWH